jgi:hypothetical protein
MTPNQLKEKIRQLASDIYKSKQKVEASAVEWDELTKFPELKRVISDLLTDEFDNFLSHIDWVSPKPTTFRINLKNGQNFFLIYGTRSWIAQVEGKKYYLQNLQEEERACESISRILRISPSKQPSGENDGFSDFDPNPKGEETPPETPEEKPEESPE